ncbi:MAG: LamB/YcsF family protein [Gemmatimonadaceae bacterium]|nr:LamB/YcsF family protein [Gemmatimonadaceae bacterium]
MSERRVAIDVSADIGERQGSTGRAHDGHILEYISSASIACGFHAGDAKSMRETVTLCAAAGAAMGAHPSYLDRDGFGRIETNLSSVEIRRHVGLQVVMLSDICRAMNVPLKFVKPHGALYNRAARDPAAADAIASAISEIDRSLTLLGLAGSEMIRAAARFGLPVAREAFLDRAYSPQGTLISRTVPGAVFTDPEVVVQRALDLVHDNILYAVDGTPLRIVADSLCLHGDGAHSIEFAKAVRAGLEAEGIDVAAFAA